MADRDVRSGTTIQRWAAFTFDGEGGNPAGVVIRDDLPDVAEMQGIATTAGYSETVFAAPTEDGYRVCYFSPEREIPFCGHATIALGAALAAAGCDGRIALELNDGAASVEGYRDGAGFGASLASPPTGHDPAPVALLEPALGLFAFDAANLDPAIPPAIIRAGARHLLIALDERHRLTDMRYDMPAGADLMREWDLATISLVHAERANLYHARNPFASGGVYEDPATGAAAAALVAYLAHLDLARSIRIIQGEDMGVPCLLHAEAPATPGGSAWVRGAARRIAAR